MPDPSLADVDAWFDKKVMSQRTAWSGLSLNRVYKSPRDLFTGNQSDPNGLCGDASSFVLDEFDKAYPKTSSTSDGYQMGLVLWQGLVLNHIANVMIPTASAFKQGFELKAGTPVSLRFEGYTRKPVSYGDFLKLHVYDLYYKKRAILDGWWDDRDGDGSVTIGLEFEFT